MKKQITIFLILFTQLLFIPVIANAYPGQYSWDPLYVEEIKTYNRLESPVGSQTQNRTEETKNRLKSSYGISDFYECYNKCGYSDLSMPSNMRSCLTMTEHCLELKKMKTEYHKKWDDDCKNTYGPHGKLGNLNAILKQYTCDCENGYELQGGICVKKKNNKLNTYDTNNNTNTNNAFDALSEVDRGALCLLLGKNYDKIKKECVCEKGYEEIGDECIKKVAEQTSSCSEDYILRDNKCITCTQDCQFFYDSNMYGIKNSNGSCDCHCSLGYVWDDNICKKFGLDSKNIVQEEKSLITKVDKNLSKRMSGNILLQVEKNGEGWYVSPVNQKKYYLGRPADAFNIMRNLGLGIAHSELNNYINSTFPNRLSGKIMLDVEQNGEAYYINPNNLKGYYLNRPSDAFRIMREFGLGITNNDVRKIDIGEIE